MAKSQSQGHDQNGALALLGLGANLGEPASTLGKACQQIALEPGIALLRTASLYRSAPVDAPGPHYINTAILLRTTLAPLELLARMQAIETAFGRRRSVRNAPRTLDIDLLWHENQEMALAELTLPHPRLHQRAFVLKPLAELLGDDFLIQGRPLGQWLTLCKDQTCDRLDTLATKQAG